MKLLNSAMVISDCWAKVCKRWGIFFAGLLRFGEVMLDVFFFLGGKK